MEAYALLLIALQRSPEQSKISMVHVFWASIIRDISESLTQTEKERHGNYAGGDGQPYNDGAASVNGGEYRRFEPVFGGVRIHSVVLFALQGAPKVLLQARLLPRPIRTSIVMTVIRSIGNDHRHITRLGTLCWAQSGRAAKAVHFATFYAPLWAAILFNGITYFQVIRMLNNATRMAAGMSDARTDMKALNRWGYYPLILIGSWFFGTINRIHDFLEPDHKIFWLSVLDVGMAALMGLFNSIAYGLNSSVRRAIYERLDLLPECVRRWLPKSFRSRGGQQQEGELIPLKVENQRL
ncbi:unnamed protein product [Cuscuta epithymum]|uniref:G-protein coupled receptors family 2 profile 2 domain-containing protein n=1 Tax=Cuscuta epithymum TaxID=186058 RepID=A0AAV0BY44_9ASTE|nr:unnamed protein product [Cuscuta epithymum]